MKKKKNYSSQALLFITSILSLGIIAGCGNENATDASSESGELETKTFRYQGSVNSVTFPELAQDLGYFDDLKLKWIGNTTSGPQDIQSTVTGDVDFGSAFNGAIVKLKAAGAPLKSVIGSYGVDEETYSGFYVLDGSDIKTAKDLIGKKVGMNTVGAHHEFMLKEFLRQNGLSEEEIKQVTLVVLPPVNIEQSLRESQIDVAVLGGILRDKALERGEIHPLFSDFDLFNKFTAGSYVMTERFIKENPNTAKKFVEGTAEAIEWARKTPREEVIERFIKIIKERNRNEDTSTVQFWKSTGIAGEGGVIAEEELSVWIDWLVDDGQLKEGDLTPKDLFTNEFNPYQK